MMGNTPASPADAPGPPSFQHVSPALRLYSGADSLGHLGRELARLGSRRAAIVCGSSLVREGRLLEIVRSALGDRCAGVVAGARAHSPLPAVQAAAEELGRLDADAVIALGGGSAVVTARAASILLAEGGDVRSLCTTRDEKGGLRSPKLLAAKLPQLIVPTTPNTAMVKAGTAVFDPDSGERLALFDPKTRAHAIAIHPDAIRSAPRSLVVSASLDTLTLAIEGLTSRSGDPISDALLMHSVRLLARHLPDQAGHDDPAVRTDLMLAAVLCGQGTDHTGAGIATVLGHAIGARFEVDNGLVKAAVMPYALRFNAETAQESFVKLTAAMGLAAAAGAAAAIDVVEALFGALQAPRRLRDVGVPREALAGVAASAIGDWFLRGNPRPVRSTSELQHILEQAW